MERAGPDVVLSRPLNGVLLLAVIASFALVFVNLTLLTLTAVLLAAYACVGRPERAWVPEARRQDAPVVAGRRRTRSPRPRGERAGRGPRRARCVRRHRRHPCRPAAGPAADDGPAIVAEIDALARAARPSIPPEAMATIGRIRELAAQALPTHDHDLNFSDHETWLVRQVACDYLPAAIEGVSRHRSAAHDAAARRRSAPRARSSPTASRSSSGSSGTPRWRPGSATSPRS